jgi:hypothetical protein
MFGLPNEPVFVVTLGDSECEGLAHDALTRSFRCWRRDRSRCTRPRPDSTIRDDTSSPSGAAAAATARNAGYSLRLEHPHPISSSPVYGRTPSA